MLIQVGSSRLVARTSTFWSYNRPPRYSVVDSGKRSMHVAADASRAAGLHVAVVS